MDLTKLREWKKRQERKLSMVTCYDYTFAKLVAMTEIDMVLVGDSSAMVMHGHEDTINANLEMICTHLHAVRKGAPKKFIIGDLPFLTFRKSRDRVLDAVMALMQAGAQAVKLEGYDGNQEIIRHLVESGVPVMGHIGLTPQFIHAFGGFKVQGRQKERAQKLLADAKGLEEAGCFAIVLECIPAELAGEITAALEIPTIGIGAGPQCDGQVLVLQDLLGLNTNFQPKFVRRYLNGSELVTQALQSFHEDVMQARYPSNEESYS